MPTTPSPTISKLDAVAFDTLLRDQAPFAASAPSFDLRTIRFITPAALVQLAAACHALTRDGRTPTVILNGTLFPSYLLRSNFFNVVSSIARFNPTIKPRYLEAFEHMRGSNQQLIELTKIESGAALQDLLDRIVLVLREQLGYRKEDAFDIAIAVSEVGQNTFEHNQDGPTCSYLAMQVYGKDPHRFLEIGVADIGDGLTATLRRNPKNPRVSSDLEAVRRATERGVSEHDDPTHGTGLYHLMEITYRHAGSVQVRSGGGTVRYRMDTKQGWGFNVPSMPGVQIALTLPAKAESA